MFPQMANDIACLATEKTENCPPKDTNINNSQDDICNSTTRTKQDKTNSENPTEQNQQAVRTDIAAAALSAAGSETITQRRWFRGKVT